MIVRVLFFAYLRDVTRTPAAEVEVPDGATVRDVWRELIGRWPDLDAQLTRIPVVVDGQVAELDAPVRAGSEVVWLPPVGGGSGEGPPTGPGVVVARLTHEALDPARLVSEVSATSCGGTVLFVGTVRDNDDHRRVLSLEYEAYQALAEAQLHAVALEAAALWPWARIAVEHRAGRLVVGEASVAVAVACPHRAEAFACCRHVIDRVKEAVPIWKREESEAGARWLPGHEFRPKP